MAEPGFHLQRASTTTQHCLSKKANEIVQVSFKNSAGKDEAQLTVVNCHVLYTDMSPFGVKVAAMLKKVTFIEV